MFRNSKKQLENIQENDNQKLTNNISSTLTKKQNQTRRNILKIIGASAASILLYKAAKQYLTIESMTIEHLPEEETPNQPYQDFDSLTPNNLEEEIKQEGTPLPAEIDLGIIPASTNPNIRQDCINRQLYKSDGRVNLQFLHAAINTRLESNSNNSKN